MNRFSIYLLLLCVASLLFACNSGEGEGGTASLEGNVKLILHPNDDYLLGTDTVDAAKTDVFIRYGDETFYGDDAETDENGFYRFKYLNKGNYTLFSYSTLSTGERIAVAQTVTVGRGESMTVPTIYIHEGKAYGTSMVKGQVWATYIHNGTTQGSGWAYEHRVYIRKSGNPYHFDDVRVGVDGYFYFQQLLPGSYEIFTITEDENEVPSVLTQYVTISETGVILELEEMFTVQINV